MSIIEVGVGLSTERNPAQAAESAIGLAKSRLRTKKIDLVFVFSSINLAYPTLLKAVHTLLGAVPVIGSSGFAVICTDGIFKEALLVVLFSFPDKVHFNTGCVRDMAKISATSAGEELGSKLLYGFQGLHRDFSLLFSDNPTKDSSGLFNGLQERLGRSFPTIGTAASGNLESKKSYVYFNTEVLTDAACGILWGGKLSFGLGIKHGWKPLGKPHRVTRSEGNIVHEIDGAPAVKIYKDYLGLDLPGLVKNLKRIAILYPIGIYISPGEECLLRNILSIENNGALAFQGEVPQESTIRLMIATKESCLNATQEAAQEVKKSFSGRQIDCALVFGSVSRYILLGRQINKELAIIKGALGKDFPVFGIYTQGAQAPLNTVSYQGKVYFHNQAMTILGMSG